MDSFGKWNNGFPCPKPDEEEVFCCGTTTYRYCCTGRVETEPASAAAGHFLSEKWVARDDHGKQRISFLRIGRSKANRKAAKPVSTYAPLAWLQSRQLCSERLLDQVTCQSMFKRSGFCYLCVLPINKTTAFVLVHDIAPIQTSVAVWLVCSAQPWSGLSWPVGGDRARGHSAGVGTVFTLSGRPGPLPSRGACQLRAIRLHQARCTADANRTAEV